MRITRWDQTLSSSKTDKVLLYLSQWHFAELSQACAARHSDLRILLENGDTAQICLYDRWLECDNAYDCRNLAQIAGFFTKRLDLDLGIDRKAVAWATFVDAEAQCKLSNDLFRSYFLGGFQFLPDVEAILFMAQRKIARILGDLPSIESLRLRFGPGATTDVKKKDASARRKLSSKYACSKEATVICEDLLAEMPGWCGLEESNPVASITHTVEVHPGRVRFVPKNAKTDRTVGIEPMLNTMVQLGIGTYISSRLLANGIDLHDQSANQRLAKEGSLTGALATLDLKSASGLICKGLVESLLPCDWWLFLKSCRTGSCESPSGLLELEQFSSMGNGFTFPLQTLIFYSLMKSVEEVTLEAERRVVSVYGDDIIIPTECVPLALRVLNACGFWVNSTKSFWSGPFRESCGKDYFSGTDVRPLFIKDALSGQDIFRLHNHYARMDCQDPMLSLVSLIDKSLRLYGPDGFGDGHLISNDYPKMSVNRKDGWGGYTFETFTFRAKRAFYKLGCDYVYPTYTTYLKEDEPDVSDDMALQALRKIPIAARSHGLIRSSRSDADYASFNGRRFLVDTLPGRNGYNRIKVYTFC